MPHLHRVVDGQARAHDASRRIYVHADLHKRLFRVAKSLVKDLSVVGAAAQRTGFSGFSDSRKRSWATMRFATSSLMPPLTCTPGKPEQRIGNVSKARCIASALGSIDSDHDDPLPQQPRVDVKGALAVPRGLDHDGHERRPSRLRGE